jgi:hypothetical protein
VKASFEQCLGCFKWLSRQPEKCLRWSEQCFRHSGQW